MAVLMSERVQKVRVSSGPMKAEGFISLDGAMSKVSQWQIKSTMLTFQTHQYLCRILARQL